MKIKYNVVQLKEENVQVAIGHRFKKCSDADDEYILVSAGLSHILAINLENGCRITTEPVHVNNQYNLSDREISEAMNHPILSLCVYHKKTWRPVSHN